MKKILYTTLLSVLFSVSLSAQVPGYLGKRLSIEYNLNQSLHFGKMELLEGASSRLKEAPLKRIHHVRLEYVLSKKLSLGLDLGMSKHQLDSYGPAGDYVHPDLNLFSSFSYHPFTLKNTQVGVGLKIFKRGGVAPAGSYHDFTFFFHRLSSDDFFKEYSQSVIDLVYGAGNDEISVNMLSAQYTRGHRFIVNDRFGIDVGAYFGLAFSIYQFLWSSGLSNDPFGGNDISSEVFRRAAHGYISRTGNFGLRLAVSYLH